MKALALLPFCLLIILQCNIFAFCFEEAGRMYGISPQILWGIAKVESNLDPSTVNWNQDGTYDFGIMQINSSWYTALGKEIWNRLGDPCINVYVGAWVLAQCIQRYGNTWEAVGCYNASSKSKRVRYAERVYDALRKRLKQN
jgi:soluble lytic murein transglycosylase-like protein